MNLKHVADSLYILLGWSLAGSSDGSGITGSASFVDPPGNQAQWEAFANGVLKFMRRSPAEGGMGFRLDLPAGTGVDDVKVLSSDLRELVREYLIVEASNDDRWNAFVAEVARYVERSTGVVGALQRPRRCVVQGCQNTSDEGLFDGSICLPCRNFLKDPRSGDRSGTSQAYRNTLDFARSAFQRTMATVFETCAPGRNP